jgi:2-keto-3-deoxy-L-rhamnonate aldolase RhmA
MSGRWAELRAGGTLYGCFLSTGYTVNAELVGRAGFDFTIIDLEHGTGAERDVLGQVQALAATGTAPLVRVESGERVRVHRVLDAGVEGVMFPRVGTAEEARACAAAMRYPPDGVRGVATLVRASDWGQRFVEYRDGLKESLLGIIQIETAEAVENVESIAAIDGADVLFVGPMDLTTSLGIFRQYDHPLFVDAVDRTLRAAQASGKAAGILLARPEEAPRYRDMGFRFLTCGTDTAFLLNAARATAQAMRGGGE